MGRVEFLRKIVPAAYALAVFLFLGSFWLRTRMLDRLGIWSARIGLLLHTVWVVSRWKLGGLAHPPWISRFESTVFFSWALMAAQFHALAREDVKDNRAASAAGSCLLAIALLWRAQMLGSPAQSIAPLAAAFHSPWYFVHSLLAAIAFGWLASGAVSAVFAWIASSGQSLSRIRAKIAEPAALERMSYRAILLGLPIQLLAILSGGTWAFFAYGSYWGWEPKQIGSLITVLFFTIFLHQKSLDEARAPELAAVAFFGLCSALFAFGGF